MKSFRHYVEQAGQTLKKGTVRCLQVNMGYRCNLQCGHCHVEAGPNRREMMGGRVMDEVVRFAAISGIQAVDITGGAPEINPHLPDLIACLKRIGSLDRISLRTNLSVLEDA